MKKKPQNMIHMNVGIEGYVTLTATGPDGKVRKTEKFKNLITNYAVNTMLSTPQSYLSQIGYCAVGTGSTTPNVTDVALVTQNGSRSAAGTTVSTTNAGAPNYNISLVRSYVFAIGAVSGNLTEVGFFSSTSGNNCGSRSLIKDSGGNPVAFPVLVTEQLTVTYEVRTVPILVDIPGSVTIAAVNYTTNLRQDSIGSTQSFLTNVSGLPGTGASQGYVFETQTLGSINGSPAGTPSANSSATVSTYTANSFFRDQTITWLPAVGNFGLGIGSVRFLGAASNLQCWQMSFTPRIPKLNTQTLTLTFRLTISRP